ncbi:MAG: hypothetical protein K2V38_04320 [Gemmataceae bacterium]|nr:hypothetical protein [Gemmataceae bacterium]
MPIEVPPEFLRVPYDAARHPQAAAFASDRGANCQLWAYALLKHFGRDVPPVRSSELSEDTRFSAEVGAGEWEPLDLLLVNDTGSPWGAHVAVYLGERFVAHLSREVGRPEVCLLEALLRRPKYRVLVGAKRVCPRERQ